MMVKGAGNHPLLHPLPLFFLLLLWSTLTTTTTKAARDNDYYYPSFINPNTEYKMYWKDSVNVLEDLDQFESLYIRYHGCVWSKYGTMYGTGEDYDEQGNDNDNDGFDNGCNGFGGGEYYWYMGRTQCFKANVAYSLYGVLKGDDPKKKRGSYCHGDSYINSFFTTYGVESFAGPMGLGTYMANSVCLSNQNGNGGNAADFSYAKVDDDYLGDDYTFYDAQSYVSQGTGCSANGHFVIDQYNGPFCHGTDYDSTLDQLEDFNSQLQDMDCVEIYSDSANNNDDDDQRRDRRDLGEDEQNYDFDYEYENYAAYHILTWSKSCSVAQYPNDCPDPYGLKHKYSQNIQRALAYKTGRLRDLGTNIAKGLSWVFFAAGVILCAGIYYLVQKDDKLTRKQDRQRRRDARKAAKVKEYKKNKDDNDDDESTVIERGIESTLSNLSSGGGKSVDSKASKKSNRSCLPKLKMPKKLKRGGGGGGAGEGSTRSATTMTALEVDYQGGVMEMEQVPDDDEELSHTDTSLAESQIYMSEKEERTGQVLSKEAPPSPVRSYLANKYNVEPAATSAQPEKENDDQSIKSGKSSASTIDRMFGRQSSYATPYTAEVQVEQDVASVRQEEEPETTGYIPMGDEGSKSKGDPQARRLQEQQQQQSDPEGYVTMEQLLDQAASFVSHTTTGVSTMNSWTTEDQYNAEGPKEEGELIISRAPTAEWGMAPVKGDDDSTLSGCSSRKGTATAGAVAGTAVLAAAAAAASPKTKSKKFPSLKLRAITSPLRKSSKKNKDKQMNMEEASPTPPQPVEGSTKLQGVPPLPVPVTPLAGDLKEDDASSLGVSQDQDILVDASSFDRIMASMAATTGQDPPADDDSEYTGDGSKPEPSDAVEQSLFDYGDVFSDEEAAAVSTIAEEDSKMVAEEEEEEDEVEVLEDGQELQLADPSSPTPKKKKKVGGFFRRNPKSPENTKSLRGLFTKSGKALSPSQMATAPPPMLVTPPSSKSTTRAGDKLKSPASPLKKKFFSSLRASRKQPQQSSDGAPTLEEPNKERDPEDVEEEQGKEEESVAELTAANAASFDLTNMIDIIEPVLPPESQKDLFSATPPMSQKSISPASQKGLSPVAAKDQQQQSGSPGGVKQVLL